MFSESFNFIDNDDDDLVRERDPDHVLLGGPRGGHSDNGTDGPPAVHQLYRRFKGQLLSYV